MPEIAIIGRQNVGKSTLFNALIGKRKSIVYNEPGVTRDLVSSEVPWGEGRWVLTDFPGFEKISAIKDDFLTQAAIQAAWEQLHNYHAIVWVFHVQEFNALEGQMAIELRKLNKPIFIALNFADDPSKDIIPHEIYKLGYENIFFISALNKRNIHAIKDALISHFGGEGIQMPRTQSSNEYKIAIIGKPNTGKSTLFNWFLKKEKALTSNIAGTTRDTLEDTFPFQGKKIRIIDTAGLRRNRSITDDIEKFSIQRTTQSVVEADGVFITIDPENGFDKQNKTILNIALEKGKPTVVLLNKIDLYKGDTEIREKIDLEIERNQKLFWPFPVYFISALDGQKVTNAVQKLLELIEMAREKIPTHRLNQMLVRLKRNHILSTSRISPKYIIWDMEKLRLIVFAGYKEIPENIQRFVLNEMRKEIGKTQLPLKIEFRK